MSEAGEATTTSTTTSTALPQAPAEAAAAVPQDPAPKSPVGGGAPQAAATAPAALVAGNPGGDATPAPTGPAAPASSAPAGGEDAEKKVLGESVPGVWGCSGRDWQQPAAEHVWASPAAFPPGEGSSVWGSLGGRVPNAGGCSPPVLQALPGGRVAPCAPRRLVRVPLGSGPASCVSTLVTVARSRSGECFGPKRKGAALWERTQGGDGGGCRGEQTRGTALGSRCLGSGWGEDFLWGGVRR